MQPPTQDLMLFWISQTGVLLCLKPCRQGRNLRGVWGGGHPQNANHPDWQGNQNAQNSKINK